MDKKEKAVLLGGCVGELYWEFVRFAPLLPYMRFKKYKKKNYTYIVFTREDRFDIYGNYADILVSLKIPGDGDKYLPNCYRLEKFPHVEYEQLNKKLKNIYKKRFDIVEHIYPNIKGRAFLRKNQFSPKEMLFTYSPRKRNIELVDKYVPNDKPLIVLAPRFRKGFKRNWKNWPEFYDMLADHKLMSSFNFIICGKKGEYIPDEKDRFYDINKITLDEQSSLVGLLIAIIRKAFFTCGSQSAIPNLSLLHKVEALEWGHQKHYHTVSYNIMKTPVTFIEDYKYNLKPETILKTLNKTLEKKLKREKRND